MGIQQSLQVQQVPVSLPATEPAVGPQKRRTPIARRQYCSCFFVSLTGTLAPADSQPSGHDDSRLVFFICPLYLNVHRP